MLTPKLAGGVGSLEDYMRIGYACVAVDVPNTGMKSCIMKNANESRLMELISHNLSSLDHILDYNIKNNIRLFRISSGLIPFGSSPVNSIPWWDIYQTKLLELGQKIINNKIRVSMHPGQYTIINSPKEEVVIRAMDDLSYHAKVLDSLGVGTEHKIILHIGGVYNDKKAAMLRFITNFNYLADSIRDRIVLENDDKLFHIGDVLEIGACLASPVVFDNLHNEINPADRHKNEVLLINECRKTWKEGDGLQKIHYSQQAPNKQPGSHSESILVDKFLDFCKSLGREDIDIMLEVKDKNISAINCIRSLVLER